MGQHDPRRFPQRSLSRARSESLDPSLQRSAPLHAKNLWSKPALFLPASAQTPSRRGRDRDESHAALHIAGRPGTTGRARERFSVSKRFHYFRRGAHGRAGGVATDRHWRLAIRTKIDRPKALKRSHGEGPG